MGVVFRTSGQPLDMTIMRCVCPLRRRRNPREGSSLQMMQISWVEGVSPPVLKGALDSTLLVCLPHLWMLSLCTCFADFFPLDHKSKYSSIREPPRLIVLPLNISFASVNISWIMHSPSIIKVNFRCMLNWNVSIILNKRFLQVLQLWKRLKCVFKWMLISVDF